MVALVYNTRRTDKDNIESNIPPQDRRCVRIVCISDTHGSIKFNVPDGDILGMLFLRYLHQLVGSNLTYFSILCYPYLHSSRWRYNQKFQHERVHYFCELDRNFTTQVRNSLSMKKPLFLTLITYPVMLLLANYRIKIVIAGNHDLVMDTELFSSVQRTRVLQEKGHVLRMFKQEGIIYLENTSFRLPPSLGGFLVYGSPYSPVHIGGAFMPEDMSGKYAYIQLMV